MAVAFHAGQIEVLEEDIYVNVETKTRTTAEQKPPGKIPQSLLSEHYGLVGLGFGLLCVVQALLNIGLRFSLYSELIKANNNLTKHNNELRSTYDNLTKHNDLLQSSYNEQKKLCGSPDWQNFGKGYYISTEKKTWEESRQFCIGIQSDLMVIKSSAKQDFVTSIVGCGDQSVWLGLTEIHSVNSTDRVWKWVDGTPLTTPEYWGDGEPNNGRSETCVEFGHKTFKRGWNNARCNDAKRWMCERVL